MRPTDHIAVDLDGVLAYADPDAPYVAGEIGAPIPAMLERVRAWRAQGIEVRIFTARVSTDDGSERRALVWKEYTAIENWCREHVGEVLPITCEKSWRCAAIYDDRAIQVEKNTGRLIGETD